MALPMKIANYAINSMQILKFVTLIFPNFTCYEKLQLFHIEYSVAQFIVFREKRKMDWREILREKWATKN